MGDNIDQQKHIGVDLWCQSGCSEVQNHSCGVDENNITVVLTKRQVGVQC